MIVDRYYYAQLNKREQAIYKAFYNGLMEYKDIIPIPVKGKLTQETFNKVFCAITRDNPLIYYLNQSACSMAQDSFGRTAICPQYFYSKDKIKEYNHKIENSVNSLAAQLGLTEGTDYEKEKKIHDWMCKNVKYDYQGADMKDPSRVIISHNILGVFAHHRAQCEGIAKAVKVLLNAVNIKCIVVTGDADGNGQNGPHAWNIVDIGGDTYQLDVTWDIGSSINRISYDYFNIPDGIMGKDHKPDSNLPECKSWGENYFEKNQLAFRSVGQLISYITKEVANGQSIFYFRVTGKLNAKKVANDVASAIARIMAQKGRRSIRTQQIPNEKVGACWIQIK